VPVNLICYLLVRFFIYRIGKKDVEEIAEGFAAEYELSFYEARAAVIRYLKLFIQWGLLAIGTVDDLN
jgi:hypothetical protein